MAYNLQDVRILIVDDMEPMLSMTKSILGIFGFKRIFTASDGGEGFKVACKEDPEIIFTDWMMDPVDGLEFTRRIRNEPLVPNPYVPIVMMTGFTAKGRVEVARDAGVTEFLVKPFTSRDMYSRIVQIIEKQRQFVDTGDFFGPDRRRRVIRDYRGPKRRQIEGGTQDKNKPSADVLKQLQEEAKNIS